VLTCFIPLSKTLLKPNLYGCSSLLIKPVCVSLLANLVRRFAAFRCWDRLDFRLFVVGFERLASPTLLSCSVFDFDSDAVALMALALTSRRRSRCLGFLQYGSVGTVPAASAWVRALFRFLFAFLFRRLVFRFCGNSSSAATLSS
jgi:hypothetical protein